MTDETPRLNLDTYEPGDTDWSHNDTVEAVDEHAIERGPIAERPAEGSYDDELYYAVDQNVLWGWSESDSDWTIRGGTGSEEQPLDSVHTETVDITGDGPSTVRSDTTFQQDVTVEGTTGLDDGFVNEFEIEKWFQYTFSETEYYRREPFAIIQDTDRDSPMEWEINDIPGENDAFAIEVRTLLIPNEDDSREVRCRVSDDDSSNYDFLEIDETGINDQSNQNSWRLGNGLVERPNRLDFTIQQRGGGPRRPTISSDAQGARNSDSMLFRGILGESQDFDNPVSNIHIVHGTDFDNPEDGAIVGVAFIEQIQT